MRIIAVVLLVLAAVAGTKTADAREYFSFGLNMTTPAPYAPYYGYDLSQPPPPAYYPQNGAPYQYGYGYGQSYPSYQTRPIEVCRHVIVGRGPYGQPIYSRHRRCWTEYR